MNSKRRKRGSKPHRTHPIRQNCACLAVHLRDVDSLSRQQACKSFCYLGVARSAAIVLDSNELLKQSVKETTDSLLVSGHIC